MDLGVGLSLSSTLNPQRNLTGRALSLNVNIINIKTCRVRDCIIEKKIYKCLSRHVEKVKLSEYYMKVTFKDANEFMSRKFKDAFEFMSTLIVENMNMMNINASFKLCKKNFKFNN